MADNKTVKNTPAKRRVPSRSPTTSHVKKTSSPSLNHIPTIKATPLNKKLTPTKLFVSPKNRTEWEVLPSPENLAILYRSVREENGQLKNQIQEFFSRLMSAHGDHYVKNLTIGPNPLLKLYDLFLDMMQLTNNTNGYGDDEGSSKPIPVVIISDSSSSDV